MTRSTGRLSIDARWSPSPRLALSTSLATAAEFWRPWTGAIAAAQKRQRATARGQMDLFGAALRTLHQSPSSIIYRCVAEILEWEKSCSVPT